MQLVQALIWIFGAVLIIAALLDRSPLLQLSEFGPSESVQTFTEGALVLDIFENTDKEAIWHGSATKRLADDHATLGLHRRGRNSFACRISRPVPAGKIALHCHGIERESEDLYSGQDHK